MRSYRPLPAIVTVLVFLAVGNGLLVLLRPAPDPPDPGLEMWLVYYAVMLPPEPPEHLDASSLEILLSDLDSTTGRVAERLQLLSYERRGSDFTLEVRHLSNGTDYRINRYGVSKAS